MLLSLGRGDFYEGGLYLKVNEQYGKVQEADVSIIDVPVVRLDPEPG